ncbi:YtxH domain-containing protein [Hymenobacter gummosus]|uniref:YtxH domain-containing protein n=1 Tax=Hymenobacter gummosus TaxID=1776032 RepID=A0A3S0K150_9BACT|nr:YtxH domain-containing protein [Hymenobacter gummosus]RTQ45322.1 YtxH domain-containing protein [Hymenobacter gummosus]
MKDNSGKVILALLAGASAGIVAGLLMAPEAGTATRDSLGKSLGKFGEDLNKLLQDGLSKLDGLKGGGSAAGDEADRSGAEDALAGLNSGGSKGSKKSGAGSSSGQDAGSTSGASSGSGAGGSASTASSSRPDGGNGSSGGFDAGGTTGGSGVGS